MLGCIQAKWFKTVKYFGPGSVHGTSYHGDVAAEKKAMFMTMSTLISAQHLSVRHYSCLVEILYRHITCEKKNFHTNVAHKPKAVYQCRVSSLSTKVITYMLCKIENCKWFQIHIFKDLYYILYIQNKKYFCVHQKYISEERDIYIQVPKCMCKPLCVYLGILILM